MKKPFVSVIIANYNGEEYLDTCLRSIINSKYKNFEILLINDGSTDRSVKIIEKFQKKDKRIAFLENRKNLGAAVSRNKAIKKAKGDIIVFLDNDTEVEKNWLNELIAPILEDKSISSSQSLFLDYNERDKIQMAGGHLIPHVGWLAPFHHKKRYSKIKNHLEQKEIIAISAALAVKKEILDKVGGFDGKEAVYTEDLDLSWRVWIAGYRIVLAPKSVVYHWTKSIVDRAAMNSTYKQIYFHLAKNSIRSILKNYEILNVIKYLPLTIVINIGRGFVVLVRSGSFSALIGTFLALWWNLVNFPNTIGKRKLIQKKRKFSDKELFKRIFVKDSMFETYNKHFKIVNFFVLISFLTLIFPKVIHAYIEPGSGSYIIQIIIASFLGITITTKMFWKKIKDFIAKILGRGKVKKGNEKDTS